MIGSRVISDPAAIAELLGGDGTEPGLEIKNCKGRSYALFPDSLRKYSTDENSLVELETYMKRKKVKLRFTQI